MSTITLHEVPRAELLQLSTAAVAALDEDGRILWASPAITKGVGDDFIDRTHPTFLSFLHPDDREQIQGIHQAALATGEPYEMTERIIRPDGELRYLSSNGQVLCGEDGAPVRMRGTCIDITERVLAERGREEHAARAQAERTRRKAALEINDNVVQGLTAALYALEVEDEDAARGYVLRTLDAARRVITDLSTPIDGEFQPGDLVRENAAQVPGQTEP